MVALDWAKAFDSIDPVGLSRAVTRFGITASFVSMIEDIYSHRTFRVRDCGQSSGSHEQRFGICQGCPLSPFLFTIVMTCVMADAKQKLAAEQPEGFSNNLSDLLYADDTLLVGTSAEGLSAFLAAICDIGREYGLALNVSKTKVLNVRADIVASGPDGQALETKTSMTYLGDCCTLMGEVPMNFPEG